ncbi:hypothetical protein [Pedobacter psychroterrae]|uniref:AhpC/TSA family protein n=1 Tax=Pedobacter psychroterrae TaxID=2530453 RepID=A0A4R0NLT3_9SPHI|nr:hypothetical protein [Pedobacter psychroterrae]TCD00513.1 hypothetical protein EZ437_14935 [Pedobacter psychroterrae]
MKTFHSILSTVLLITSWSSLLAQTDDATAVKKQTTTIKGADLNKMLGNVRFTDRKIYDIKGNVVDSAEAERRVKSFESMMGWVRKENGEYKRLITNTNTAIQAQSDSITKIALRPNSPKLQVGVVLDLKPLSKYVKPDGLAGKAVMLIFWCDGCYAGSLPNSYSQVNEVLLKYKNPEKLKILTITHHSVEHVSTALAKNPIVNDRHILDATAITDSYETGNRPIIVLTDKSHKIVYSIRDNAIMTPRLLDKLFREIL